MTDPKHAIEVSVDVAYQVQQSNSEAQRYVFAYTITLHNRGTEAARLLRRHWLITNADGKSEEVHGDGVVGQTPRIEPGHHFTYTSAVMLATPVGVMQGHYDFEDEGGHSFRVPIAPFTLATPGILN